MFLLSSVLPFVVSTANFCTTLKRLVIYGTVCARPDTDNRHVRGKKMFCVIKKAQTPPFVRRPDVGFNGNNMQNHRRKQTVHHRPNPGVGVLISGKKTYLFDKFSGLRLFSGYDRVLLFTLLTRVLCGSVMNETLVLKWSKTGIAAYDRGKSFGLTAVGWTATNFARVTAIVQGSYFKFFIF